MNVSTANFVRDGADEGFSRDFRQNRVRTLEIRLQFIEVLLLLQGILTVICIDSRTS